MPPVPLPAKLLVTGANGYIASWIVRTLLERATVSTVDVGFAEAAYRAAGGNPFFTSELARAVVRAKLPPVDGRVDELDRLVPNGVASAFRTRIEDLAPETLGVKELKARAFQLAEEKWWDCREEILALEEEQEAAGIQEVVSLAERGDAGAGPGARRR